jgi:PAS domain S-box-containing protein
MRFLERLVAEIHRLPSTVRGTLLGIVLLTTMIVLLVTGVALLIHDLAVYRASYAKDVATEASILALSTAPSLAFDNREVATSNLEALKARPSILAAALYTPDGRLYTQFAGENEPSPPATAPNFEGGVNILGERVEISQPIRHNEEFLGTIYLRARYDVTGRVQAYLGIFAMATALSIVLALMLSSRSLRGITIPLEAIADVARRIIHGRDYSLRVARTTDDEIGIVVRALNNMLDEIQMRTQALEASNQSLRDSENIYRAIGESIHFGVWLTDADGRNTYASPSFLELTGKTMEQVAEFGWGDVLHPDDVDQTLAAWRDCVEHGTPWYREHRYLGTDGNYHPVLAQGVPIRREDGSIYAWAGINLDISRLKQSEDALREADRRKDEFLATLAHELRNPLAPVRHATHLLGLATATEAQRQWGREVIARQVEHMALLLDDLLDVSRITRGRLELRKDFVPLSDLVATAVETVRPLMDSKQHHLDVRLPPAPVQLHVDPLRIAQSLSNLLTNAAKYTDTGGRIALEARASGGGVAISVSDNGIGLARTALPQLFEMFSQVESAMERSQGGLGIGLSLVRGLVTLHGGTVEAASEGLGLGSTFTIRLPATCVVEERPTESVALSTPVLTGPTCRVLVADDNRDAAESLSMLLGFIGYEVVVAHSGREALDLALREKPQALILDIGMPELSGYEVAQGVREQPWGREALLVALTGWGQQDDMDRARDAGFDHHFRKPVDVRELQARLAAFCLRRDAAASKVA